jgi:murein DD-endopeptidase MepM/ murein hydrolase activator NlpD
LNRSVLRACGLRTALAALVVGLAWVVPLPARAAPAPPVLHTVAGTVLRPLPWRLPVTGYHLTGRFGDVSGLWGRAHTGLDFATAYGSPIRSVAAGVVVSVGYDGAYGEKTVVRLRDGTVLWYCHQSRARVRPGERVPAGRVIGAVGTSGNTTGPHLHLEVHLGGRPVDPYPVLVAHRARP